MPHVVVEGAGDLHALYQNFAPILQRAEQEILKVQEFYLAKSGREALLDAVVIEQGVARSFFIQLKQHEGTITVRLLPATDPEKTPAVKKRWRSWRDSFELCVRRVGTERPICRNS